MSECGDKNRRKRKWGLDGAGRGGAGRGWVEGKEKGGAGEGGGERRKWYDMFFFD